LEACFWEKNIFEVLAIENDEFCLKNKEFLDKAYNFYEFLE